LQLFNFNFYSKHINEKSVKRHKNQENQPGKPLLEVEPVKPLAALCVKWWYAIYL